MLDKRNTPGAWFFSVEQSTHWKRWCLLGVAAVAALGTLWWALAKAPAEAGTPNFVATEDSTLECLATFPVAPIEPQNPALKLWEQLDDVNEEAVLQAIRGLSVVGGEEATARFEAYLKSNDASQSQKIEAATALGTMGSPEAGAALVRVLDFNPNLEIKAAIMCALAKLPFDAKSETIFRAVMNAKELPVDFRVEAIEALVNCPEGVGPFLVEIAANAADWQVRAGAAWAISGLDAISNGSGTLLALAAKEPDEVVRRRFYEAVVSHANVSGEQLFELVLAEKDTAARVAGFNAAAVVSQRQPGMAERFDAAAVEEMVQVALSQNPENLRLRAVFALRRAQTPAAIEALSRIGAVCDGAVAAAASADK